MSKVVRERLQQTIQCMEEATQVIEKKCSNLQQDKAPEKQLLTEFLTEVQDLAIAFGTRIEQLRGIGTRTVTELESYCECLFHVNESMGSLKLSDTIANLVKQMECVRNAFEKDFPNKKEIVFLPYKASMWDSLESVWKAADADPECEVYVVPIPYYTLDEKRNFKDFFYEGDLYPKYVPVTHYKEYNLELHHPDVIYVHNPYDEFNTVTSIAPEYYLKKIKDYTEKLVYIPYFVLTEIDPTNHAAIEAMSHFCFLPGTLYADQVILQSENMRQIYINEYIKAAEKQNIKVNRTEAENKFLGLGSPKFDKVVNVRKEDVMMPQEWLRIIQKPDGTYKKVIFYNTSVGSLLNTGERMLLKMKNVFKQFKEKQEQVTLLWRPHPLMKDTLESMLPDLVKEYQQIVEEYKEEGWGIYDDTPDLDRAIAISDAYYGDGSSVVQLCQKVGMPIMIQNVGILY